MIGIDPYVQVAIRGAVQRDHATLDRGTFFNYMQPFPLTNVVPQVGIAVFSLQLYGRFACIANSRHHE